MINYYPETLKTVPIWTLWRLEPDEKNRPTKVPYSPNYDGRASSINPSTWGTFDQAVHKFNSRPNYYNGISIIISKNQGLVFIDIDHCINEDGELNEVAYDIIESFHKKQYIEISQSGTGIHIITKGTIPKNFKNSGNGVEMYCDKRFCALTGNVLFKGDPTEEQSVIDELFQRYKTQGCPKKTARTAKRALNNSDKWVIDHAAGHGRFDDLFSGDWTSACYNSQSEADLALCMILAFWTDCNTEQMDRIFRSSGLYRDKWERNDYRESTLQNAINLCDDTVSEYRQRENQEGGERLDRALCEQWDEL